MCIYCKKTEANYSVEHIIPDSIGCPPDLILKHEVCEKCNNKLAVLDNRVIQEYDLIRWMSEIPNKKGKIPKISSIRNVYTDDKGMMGDKKRIVFNSDSKPVKIEKTDIILPGYRKNSSAIDGTLKIKNNEAHFKLSRTFDTDRKFIRGIYKIGFEMQCLLEGKEKILSPFYDQYRDFIYHDIGDMELVFQYNNDHKIFNSLLNTYSNDAGRAMIVFRLLVLTYIVNLTNDEKPFDLMIWGIKNYKNIGLKYVRTIGNRVEYI